MNKPLRAFICLLAALTVLPSCSGNDGGAPETAGADAVPEAAPDAAETDAPPETEPAYDPLPETDLGGRELRFYNYDDSWLSWVVNILDPEELNGDVLNDAVWNRNNRLEETLHCVISETADRNPADKLPALVKAGDAGAEIVMLYDETIVNQYLSGNLRTWDALPYVDFGEPCWSWDATRTFASGGRVYAATGDFSLAQSTRSFIMMFNKDMYADLGLGTPDDLYETVRDGAWTLDRYLSDAEKAVMDLNGDGVMDMEDRYGCATAIKLYFGSLVSGAGIKYVDTDAEGNACFAIPGNEYALNVMSDILSRHSGNHIFKQVADTVHDGSAEGQQMFIGNHTLFQGSSMKAVSVYRDMDSDIGILPFPKYSEEQTAYYALTSGGTMATLPATLPDELCADVGLLLESMCRLSRETVIPVYKETLLKSRYARDQGSADMLDIIFASALYDIGLSVIPSDTYYKYMEVFMNGTDTFSSLTQSITKMVNKQLDKLAKKD